MRPSQWPPLAARRWSTERLCERFKHVDFKASRSYTCSCFGRQGMSLFLAIIMTFGFNSTNATNALSSNALTCGLQGEGRRR